jgi:hypothetical protein
MRARLSGKWKPKEIGRVANRSIGCIVNFIFRYKEESVKDAGIILELEGRLSSLTSTIKNLKNEITEKDELIGEVEKKVEAIQNDRARDVRIAATVIFTAFKHMAIAIEFPHP